MLSNTADLLKNARQDRYAVGAFNIYNLEGAKAVVLAAEKLRSPVILQLLPAALDFGGVPLISLCQSLARNSDVPVGVHLDHCSSEATIQQVLEAGLVSIMADGSALEYEQNIRFTRRMVEAAAARGGIVEAELGKLAGEEDGLSVSEKEARMTDPDQAVDFVSRTGVAALAVCIGNVHGRYMKPPELDFNRLQIISSRLSLPLVLHGTSGLPDELIHRVLEFGVCKFNVNTEVRKAGVKAISALTSSRSNPELMEIMKESVAAMQTAVEEKIELFQSSGKA